MANFFLLFQRYLQLNRIVSIVKFLFCKAHPDQELSSQMQQKHTTFARSLHSPAQGVLSCSKAHSIERRDLPQNVLAKQVRSPF